MTTQIQADAIYPYDGNTATITRQYCPTADPWPTIQAGDTLEVLDGQGWLWDAKVTEVKDAAKVVAKVDNKRPSPMPTPSPEGTIRLPNMSGHAHCRDWRSGDVIRLHDDIYKVKGKPRELNHGASIVYTLVKADEKAWSTRPGRLRMSSEHAAREAVGSAVQTETGEWLEAKEVKFRRYGSAEGDTFGRTWLVFGKYVPEDKANRINYVHPQLVSNALHNAKSARHHAPMPDTACALIQGERVAIDGKTVLHERIGDPDMIDSRYPYVVAIEDKDLLARVKKTIAKQGVKKT